LFDGQMKQFSLDIKADLSKMLAGKERILVNITRDEGSVISDKVISTDNFKLNGDVLVVNDKMQLPVTEESIASVTDDQAELSFVDLDGCMNYIKIMAR